MTQTPLSLTLFGVAVAFYVAALVAFVAYLPFRRRRIADTALGLTGQNSIADVDRSALYEGGPMSRRS